MRIKTFANTAYAPHKAAEYVDTEFNQWYQNNSGKIYAIQNMFVNTTVTRYNDTDEYAYTLTVVYLVLE